MPVDILKTAAALMAMTTERGCTAEEAATAAGKLIALAERHGVTLDDLRADLGDQVHGIITKPVPLGLGGSRIGRRGALVLAEAIASGFECRSLSMKRFQGLHEAVMFMGFEADVVCAIYAYQTILPRLLQRVAEQRLGAHKTSFLIGSAVVIRDRLAEQRAAVRDAGAPCCTGIILRDRKQDLIGEQLKAQAIPLAPKQRIAVNHAAYALGRNAAERVPLRKGVA